MHLFQVKFVDLSPHKLQSDIATASSSYSPSSSSSSSYSTCALLVLQLMQIVYENWKFQIIYLRATDITWATLAQSVFIYFLKGWDLWYASGAGGGGTT